LAAFSLSTGGTNGTTLALQYFVYSTIIAVLIALAGIKYSVSNKADENWKRKKREKKQNSPEIKEISKEN